MKNDQKIEVSKNELLLMIQDAVERGVATALSMHPRPSSVNFEQAAEMLGLSSKTVSNMVRQGRINLNKLGRISIAEIDRLLSAKRFI
jgi:excisionase family DNA binding protein